MRPQPVCMEFHCRTSSCVHHRRSQIAESAIGRQSELADSIARMHLRRMGRAPFQVLVFPYRRSVAGTFEYAIFRRTDLGVWQAIAGGGEGDERPEATAAREAYEEAGIPSSAPFM